MLLMIDNYDSFTYNVVRYFQELGQSVTVVRNDEIGLDELEALKPERIIISPGPCTPTEAGISVPVIQRFAGRLPILGICLGHQCIGYAFGGKISRAEVVMHGKTSPIWHNNNDLFTGLPNPFEAARYHSLVVDPLVLPNALVATAWTRDSAGAEVEIMALNHRSMPIFGVQFHPEAILSEYGHQLFENFLRF